MKTGKRLWFVVSLLGVVAFLLGGCAGHPEGLKNPRELTDSEKDRVIEIALNTPEALRQLEKESTYRASLLWVAIV